MRARNPREYRGYEYEVHPQEGWYEIPALGVIGIADDEDEAVEDVHDVVDAILVREFNPRQRLPNIVVRKSEAEKLLRKPLKGRKTDYYVLSEKRTKGVPKNLGGPYSSLEQAKTRLRQVEYFKRVKPSRRAANPALAVDDEVEFTEEVAFSVFHDQVLVHPGMRGRVLVNLGWQVALDVPEANIPSWVVEEAKTWPECAGDPRCTGHVLVLDDEGYSERSIDQADWPTIPPTVKNAGKFLRDVSPPRHAWGIPLERQRNWDSAAEAKEYALKRWGHEAYRAGVDTTSMTWREYAAWIRRSADHGAEAAARAVEDEPGRVGDFPLPVDPIPRQYLAETLARGSRAARSTLNPRDPGISPMLGELENLLGPLSQGHKEAILDYLEQPTEEGWDRIHSLILSPDSLRLATTWQWVMHVDPTFPRSRPSGGRWPRIPDPFTVARAIRAAANKRGDSGGDGDDDDDDNGGDGDDGEPLPVPLAGGRSFNRAPQDDLQWRRADRYEGVLHPGDYSSGELAPGIRYELRRRQVWDVWLVRGDTATRVASNRDLEGARRAAARDAAEVLSLAREIADVSPRAANPKPEWDLQTVIVSKDVAPTRAKATTIAREFAKRVYTSRGTSDSWRFRQRPPKDFVEKSFRTRTIPGRGVALVYGRLKRGAKAPTKRRR